MIRLIFIFLAITSFTGLSQEPVADFAEVEPRYPGGEDSMTVFIQNNIEYPEKAVIQGDQGIVYTQFVVNTDGSVEQVKIVRGVSAALDAEAIRVISLMPNWSPGEQKGKKVRCRYTVPIHFRLDPKKEDKKKLKAEKKAQKKAAKNKK